MVTVDPHLHRWKSLDAIYRMPTRIARAAPAIATWVSREVERPLLVGPDAESEQWVAAVAAECAAPYVVLEKLRRGDRESVVKMLDASRRLLQQGSSIMMFPEGTRSADGKLRAFKHGAFTLAQRMRAPILPIVVEGTAAALPKRGFVLQGRHAIRIRVLDAIPYTRFANESAETVAERVRAVMAAALGPEYA